MNASPIGSPDDIPGISTMLGFVKDWAGLVLGSGAFGIIWRTSKSKADMEAALRKNAEDIVELKKLREQDARQLADLRESVAKLPTRSEVSGYVDGLRQDIRNIDRPVRD